MTLLYSGGFMSRLNECKCSQCIFVNLRIFFNVFHCNMLALRGAEPVCHVSVQEIT